MARVTAAISGAASLMQLGQRLLAAGSIERAARLLACEPGLLESAMEVDPDLGALLLAGTGAVDLHSLLDIARTQPELVARSIVHLFDNRPSAAGKAYGTPLENTYWSYGVDDGVARPFVLSVESGHFQFSGQITSLGLGEFCGLRFRVHRVTTGTEWSPCFGIATTTGGVDGPGWYFYFAQGEDRIAFGSGDPNGHDDYSWYVPGGWNQVRVTLRADGDLLLGINQRAVGRTWVGCRGGLPLYTAATGLTVEVGG